MKKILLTALAFITIAGYTIAQKASIREIRMPMKTYMFSDPDPVPEISRIYPYFRYEGFTNRGVEKEWNMVILENDYIQVYVCPDIGGKIWGAIEKSTGREFMYFNSVVKFRDVAMRGAWTSGGLEYNFGDIGHDPNGATPVNYTTRENADGSVSCIVGAMDLVSRTKWNVEIKVYKNRAYFETKASWFNNTAVPCTYYHWMNAAAKSSGNLQFLYPGNKKIGHGGEFSEWPFEDGRDISFYENNNFGIYKSYHVINSYSDYFGGYWHDDDFGFGHYALFDEKPGKKIWIWGLSEQGMIWEDLLTDSDGQYVEYQSGKLFNQGAYSSTFTPFRHREFVPYDSDIMKELWFPLKNTGGMVAASEYAVLNVKKTDSGAEVILLALQPLADKLAFSSGERTIVSEVKLQPLGLIKTLYTLKEGEKFTIELGNKKLYYSSDDSERITDRPVEPDPDFSLRSAAGLYTLGLENEKQRMYTEALQSYLKCLGQEPAYLPALGRAALAYYRRMEYDSAAYFIEKALAVDAYDPLANYLFGLVNQYKGEKARARSGFSIASQSVEYRNASYTELAIAFLKENNIRIAREYALKALDFNRNNITALEILALIARMENNMTGAEESLRRLDELDPTSTFSRFEKVKWGTSDTGSFKQAIINELKHETFLELALLYFKYGFNDEAAEVLKASPEHAIVLLWLAYLEKDDQASCLKRALGLPVEMVFPHRDETAMMLQHFIGMNDNWKLKYYLALIMWNKGLMQEAEKLMNECGNEPDEFIFYMAGAELFREDETKRMHFLEKAKQLKGDDWRVNLAWTDHYIGRGDYQNSLKLAEGFLKKYPEKSEFGFRYAKSLLGLKQYDKGIKFFEKFIVIPNEGATEGRNIYHETCIRAAYDALARKNYRNAAAYAQKAKSWLPNLGVGRPYDVDERLDNFIIAYAHDKAGNKKMAEEFYSKVKYYSNPDYMEENSKLVLQVLLLRDEGRNEDAEKLIRSAVERFPENEYVRWVKAYYEGDPGSEKLKNGILNNPVKARIYDIKFIDEEFRLLTDLLEIVAL